MKKKFCVMLVLMLLVTLMGGCEEKNENDSPLVKDDTVTLYLLTDCVRYNEGGEAMERLSYTYDERGLVLFCEWDRPGATKTMDDMGIETTTYYPCDGAIDARYSHSYDRYGNPVSYFRTYYIKDYDGEVYEDKYETFAVEYTYDDDGRIELVQQTYSEDAFERLKYDERGNVIAVQIYDTQKELLRTVKEFEYDEDDNLIEFSYTSMDGERSYDFGYDRNGNLSSYWGHEGEVLVDENGCVTRLGDKCYAYEDGMLSEIDGTAVDVEETEGGLTARCSNLELNYVAIELSRADADLARYMWNWFYGSNISVLDSFVTYGVRWPISELNTVLMLPWHFFGK